MLRHKFNAVRTEIDNIKFASKKEAKRYTELKRLQTIGEILFFLRQVPFHLPANIRYVCDYLVFWANGRVTIEDVKGVKTSIYILKKKQVEEIYNVTITEI